MKISNIILILNVMLQLCPILNLGFTHCTLILGSINKDTFLYYKQTVPILPIQYTHLARLLDLRFSAVMTTKFVPVRESNIPEGNNLSLS